jgi:hypothetical protein
VKRAGGAAAAEAEEVVAPALPRPKVKLAEEEEEEDAAPDAADAAPKLKVGFVPLILRLPARRGRCLPNGSSYSAVPAEVRP